MSRHWIVALLLITGLSWAGRADARDAIAKEVDSFAKDLEEGLRELGDEGEPAKAGTPAPAEESKTQEIPNTIVSIEVRGNQIVSTNTILSKVKSRRGEPLMQATVNEDIKRLYGTGFFQDIQIEVEERPDGYALVVSVVEKPIVRQIILEGYTVFKEDKLRKEFKIIEGQILDRKVVKEGVEALRKLYGDKGFRFVGIRSEIDVNRETKEATIYIRIDEGEKYKIRDIRFEGVAAFKERQLRKLMKTKKKGWFFRSGVFKQADFEKDLERLQLFYQQEGYLDVKATPSFEYDREGRGIYVTITIDEGRQYVTGDIKIEGNRLFPESEIWEQLQMLPGKTYSQYYLSKDMEQVREYYHGRGYMDARVLPDVRLNRDTGKVDLLYRIQEGDLYFVEKVVIRGNTKTRDMVIRRELRIRPGERFDGEKLALSKQRLENLGFFDEVTYDTQPSQTAPNRKDLIFRVKEKRTGELSFGGGISSVDRFMGFAEISQRNFDLLNFPRFTGGGQSLSLRARAGTITQNYNLSFIEPYLFNRPYSLGVDLYDTTHDATNVDFEEERRGFGLTVSRLLRDIYRVGTGYTLERVEIDDLSEDAPPVVRRFEGTNWLSRWRLFGSYDTRDNVFNPTRGMLATLSGELVGSFLGGDQDFYILRGSVTKYWTIFNKQLIEAGLRLGTSQDFGDSSEVPIFDRFYAGGLGTVRGFNYRRVGPLEAGDAVGGESMVIANLEYSFPIPRLEGFRTGAFIDLGHVNEDSYKVDFGEFAVSIGPGIKIRTPIGPVAFYYGFPIANRDVEDRNGRFEFSLSRGF